MSLLTCYATLNGAAVGDGPIFVATAATLPMSELNQFSKGSVVLAAANARAILAMQPYTLIEVVQEGVGTIFLGYVLNPRQQITDRDEHTITLELEPLTVELTWRQTRRGWVAANHLSVIADRLGKLVPGWVGVFTGAGSAADIVVSVTLNSTVLAAFLDTARRFGQYARLSVLGTGAPGRGLEMGQFGAAPTVTLVSADGGDPDALAANGTIRLIATVDREPNDVSSLVNVVVPFGGGSSSDTLVTLERLWRILYDPTYVNFGKFGAVPGSVFPEFDPAYPIADPTTGNRAVTLDGHYDYPVYDAASYAAYGYKEGTFVDSSLTYADNSVANQELTARALYVSCVANFKRYAHAHHAFTCTAPGVGYPTRAGDLIAVDYRRVSADETGAIVEMDVRENLRVMSVVRSFQGDSAPLDTYTLSNLGRFDETDAVGANTAQQLVALQIRQDTGLGKDSVVIRDNIDAVNPITHWLYVSSEHFRYHQVRVRCDFLPFRGTATTAVNSAATITLSVPHGSHNLAGAGVTSAGITGTTEGFQTDLYAHVYGVNAIGAAVGAANYPESSGNAAFGRVGNSINVPIYRNTALNAGLDKATTASPFTAAVNKAVALEHDTLSGPLPQHVHDVEKRIPTGQPSPASITMSINGQALSSGKLATGTRDASGAFTTSFVVDDIGPELDAFAPGTDVPITFSAGTNADNPFGVGYVVVTLTMTEELGGLTRTFRAT